MLLRLLLIDVIFKFIILGKWKVLKLFVGLVMSRKQFKERGREKYVGQIFICIKVWSREKIYFLDLKYFGGRGI